MKCCTSCYQPCPQQDYDDYDDYDKCKKCKKHDDDDKWDKCKKHDDDDDDDNDKCKKCKKCKKHDDDDDDDDKCKKCKKCKKHDDDDEYDKVNKWYPCCPCHKHDYHKKPSYTISCGCKPPQMPPCYKCCPPCYKPPCYKPPYTPPTMPGGSTEFHPLTSHDTYVFNTAIANLVGVSYEPLLVSTQVVNGTNYTFIAKATTTTNPPKTYYVMITVFEALPSAGGTITLGDIKPITN